MKNFELSVTFENGKLYIYEENGSGVRYACNSPKDVGDALMDYLDSEEEGE